MSDEFDDDGDAPAFESGTEAVDNAAGDDDESGEDSFESQANLSGALTVTPPRGQRPVSAKVRQLYKEAAAKIAAQRAVDPDALDDDYVPAVEAPDATNPAPVVPPTGVVSSSAAPASTTPPAPSLDPEVAKLREQWNAKHAELTDREKRITEAEQSGDFGKLREMYFDKGMAPAVYEAVKKWEGSEDPEALKDAVADLVTDLSVNYLGVEVPAEVKQRLENKRAVKSVRLMKESIAQQEKSREAKLQQAQQEEQRVHVRTVLSKAMSEAKYIEQFPYLAAEEHPGSLILDVYEAQKKRDGTELHWEEAAKRANEFLGNQASAWFDKRKHLLAKAPTQATVANGKPSAQQGDQQVRRSSPQSPPPQPQPASNGKWDPEAHRRSTKAKFRQVFKEHADD